MVSLLLYRGFVRDAQATPVAYVTVRAISSGQETQTDEKGFYSINLRTDDSIAFCQSKIHHSTNGGERTQKY